MASFQRLHVLNIMIETGIVPVFYHPDTETARSIVAALAAGGARIIEFTNRGDRAFEVFQSTTPPVTCPSSSSPNLGTRHHGLQGQSRRVLLVPARQGSL